MQKDFWYQDEVWKVHGKLQYTFTASYNNNAESMLLERAAKEEAGNR